MADPAILVDASAFVALILSEPGAEAVAAVLDRAAIGAVNLAESIEVALRHGVAPARAAAFAEELGLPVVPFDAAAALHAAILLQAFRRRGLSLADCACLGTARARAMPVLTADRLWAELDTGVEVRLLR